MENSYIDLDYLQKLEPETIIFSLKREQAKKVIDVMYLEDNEPEIVDLLLGFYGKDIYEKELQVESGEIEAIE